MILVADKTQNIYGTDVTWLDGSLRGTGISSSWYNLETSYRLPPEIVPILEDFAENFLISSDVETDIPKTALTRLKKHPNGSMLTVVSSCRELYNFGEKNFSPNFFLR